MRQYEARLNALQVAVCVVTFDADVLARRYVAQTHLAWPLLLDRERQLYRAYGMERGKWSNILGLRALAAYVKLMLRGHLPGAPGSDVRQLGGDVLIDPQGRVRLHHVGTGPADRPAAETLLAEIERHP